MKLFEFFTYDEEGAKQDKTYGPENDISILDKADTRKTRLTLKDINSMRLASEAHDAQQKEESSFGQILILLFAVHRGPLMLISLN